ncbi:hypothetical protein ACFUN8_05395 [Streptomyces sp. NPDC057307]|uniref:hypothetical protein n=1 Tax=Streptomyces sp. NPDC057307 TaxID=3346096 RepID=UPI00363F2E3C
MSPVFLRQAGTAGQDWLFGAPFTDPRSVSRTFRTAYREKYGAEAGRWSPEAYDAVGLVARALEPNSPLYFLFQARGGTFRFLGRYDQVE